MNPVELDLLLRTHMRADLQAGTLDGAPAMTLTLTFAGKPFCKATCAVPAPAPVPLAECPHPHGTTDDVRSALLGVVAELRRAAKVCEGSGQHYRADAFYDAATYIEDGKWPTTYGLGVKP